MASSLVWSHTKTVRACNAPEIPPAEWEKHRELLKELYITQNKTLTEVKDCMRTRFGFSPSYVPAPVLPVLKIAIPANHERLLTNLSSTRQYTRKFDQWQYFKNA